MAFTAPPASPTSPPTAPTRADADAAFSAKADAQVAWFSPFTTFLQSFVTWVTTFISELTTAQADITTKASAATTSAANAATSEANAAASAVSANNALNNPSYIGTSSTSLTIGSGTKVLTTQSGKNWSPMMELRIYSDSSNYMIGLVTSYSGTTLTFDVLTAVGSGTISSWQIGFGGQNAADEALVWSIFLN